jgi:hypothetical protein
MKHPKSLKVVFAALAVSMVPLFGSCDSDELTIPALTNVSQVNSWSFTLPEEITQEFGRLTLGWYTFTDEPVRSTLHPDFGGELLKENGWLISQTEAGQDVRLTLIEYEGGSYFVIWQGRYWSVTSTIRNPLFGEDLDPQLVTTISWPELEPLQLMSDIQKNKTPAAPLQECLYIFQTKPAEKERTSLSLQVSFKDGISLSKMRANRDSR